jgi:hypothetical protein
MDKLEKYITENLEQFDSNEPPAGHFKRFEEKLDARFGHQKLIFTRSFVLRIAAVMMILLTVSVFVFDFATHRIRNFSLQAAGTEIPIDLQEAINYYDNTAADNLGKIQKLACCGQDTRSLYSMASGELDALDANAADLRKTLGENPGDERVQSALIRSKQMKETIMNNMIRKMKNAKK